MLDYCMLCCIALCCVMLCCLLDFDADRSHVLVPDIDIISTSAVHQGVPHVDFSLKIDH